MSQSELSHSEMSPNEVSSNEMSRPEQPMRGLSNHETDSVGFFFGVLFLVCAAAAIALRTVPLGESADEGVAVAAAAVLLVAGVVGIGGSLRNHHRRARRACADSPAAAVTSDVAAETGEDQPPKTWTT